MGQVVMMLDFGTSKVSCMIATTSGHGCQALGAASESYDGFLGGKWVNAEHVIDAVYQAVRAAQNSAKRRPREVYIVVPGDYIRVICGKAANQDEKEHILGDDMQRLIDSTQGIYRPDRYKVIHRSSTYYTWDARRLQGADAVRRMDGLVGYVLADTLFLREVQTICDDLGLVVRGYVASSLGQALTYIPYDERSRMVALCDVGYLSTQVAVFQAETMIYHETLPVGGFHIASDITYGIDCHLDVAETIKRRYVFGMSFDNPEMRLVTENDGMDRVDGAKVQQIIESRCEEISEMIQYSLNHCGYRLGERMPLYISGGGLVMMRGVQQFLAQSIERPIKVITPGTATFNTPNHAGLVGAVEYVLDYAKENRRGRGWQRLFGRE